MDARQILALSDHSELKAAAPPSSTKLASFNAPQPLRKTKRQRDIDAQLEKQRLEEEEAAKAYADFIQAFDVDEEDDTPLNSTPRTTATRAKGKGFVRAELDGKTVYNPTLNNPLSAVPTPPSQPKASSSTIPTGPRSFSDVPTGPRTNQTRPIPPPPEPISEVTASAPKPFGRKKRDMDNFLEQLKREQKEREARFGPRAGQAGSSITALAAREYAPTLTGAGYGSGSYAVPGDPLTTNLHVSPLPLNITEETLGLFFAQYGPVGSVKIMWPRTDGPAAGGPPVRRSAGQNLGGFVAYLRRPDAVKAAKELDGFEWGGNVLRIGWGKSVPLPSDAIYEIEGAGSRRRQSHSASNPSSPRASSSRQHSDQPSSSNRRRSTSRSRSPPRRIWPKLETEEEEHFLSTVATKVKEHGNEFERVLREREKSNPKFEFFWDERIPSYHYFRMLLDRRYQAPTPEQIFEDEGSDSAYSTDSAEESETESLPKGKLGKFSRRRFASLLRGLSGRRVDVARGMKFALDRGDAGDAISSLLISSLLILSTPLPQKLARLHLLSDILHNSALSLPHAWTYRSLFSSKLKPVFDHLNLVHRAIDGRLNAEKFRMKIISLVEIWEGWCVFELGLTEDLRRRLNGEEEVTPGAELEMNRISAATAVYRPPWIPAAIATTKVEATVPIPDLVERPSKFSKSGFKSASFQPAPIDDFLPDAAPTKLEEDLNVDGEDIDGDEADVDVDGEELDGDVIEIAPVVIAVSVPRRPKAEELMDDEPMVLDDSDDDIFA